MGPPGLDGKNGVMVRINKLKSSSYYRHYQLFNILLLIILSTFFPPPPLTHTQSPVMGELSAEIVYPGLGIDVRIGSESTLNSKSRYNLVAIVGVNRL